MFRKITLLLLFASHFGSSQTLVGTDNSGFFFCDSRYFTDLRESVLTKYNSDSSSLIYKKKIPLNKDETTTECFVKNEKVFLFSWVAEKEAKKLVYLLRVFDSQTGNMIGDVQVVDETSTDNAYGGFTVLFSPDSKKMMTSLYIGDSRGLNKIEVKAYETSKFKKLWEKEIASTVESSSVSSWNYLIDNDGRLIYLVSYSSAGSKEVTNSVCISQPQSTTNAFLKIPSDQITIHNLDLQLVNNELICTGEFLEGVGLRIHSGTLSTKGFFSLFIDAGEVKIKTASYDLLTSEVSQKLDYKSNDYFYRNAHIKKSNKIFKHFGSYYVNGNFYVIKYHGYDYKTKTGMGTYTYNYGREIVVIKYNLMHKLEWMKVVPRNMVENSVINADLLLVSAGKELCLLYYDTQRNIQKYPDINFYKPGDYKSVGAFNGTVLPVCVSISKDGVLKRKTLSKDEKDLKFFDNQGSVINSSTVLMAPEVFTSKIRLLHLDN